MSRKVDDLGRIVLPAEMRKAFNIKDGDHLDISVEDERIILSKRQDHCVFCRSQQDLKEFREQMVCATCIGDLTGATPETGGSWEPFAQT